VLNSESVIKPSQLFFNTLPKKTPKNKQISTHSYKWYLAEACRQPSLSPPTDSPSSIPSLLLEDGLNAKNQGNQPKKKKEEKAPQRKI